MKASAVDILSGTPLFGGLPEDQLEKIGEIAVGRDYVKREMVFFEGEEARGFYVVASGRVKIFKVSAEGREQILHIFGPGEPFGEVPVFIGKSYPAGAQTLVKSRLLFLPRAAFVQLIEKNPPLALNMLGVLSMRLRQFTVQIENLTLKEVPGRLAAYLLYLDQSSDKEEMDKGAVRLNISKRELANLLGTVPETLSRIFGKMSGEGLIQVDGPQIRLLDRLGLTDLAEQGKLLTDSAVS